MPSVTLIFADNPAQNTIAPVATAMTRKTTTSARKMKNSTLAIPAAAAETPLKPKNPATMEMMKKIRAHLSIGMPRQQIVRILRPWSISTKQAGLSQK